MATLSPASAAAIARLRSYVPPPTTWYSLPLSRRAAVLILLFADKRGDLRVVLTMRSATLKSYAGQAALPGGKTDSLQETPLQTARREASEEIGLPMPGAYEQTPLPDIIGIREAIDDCEDPSLMVPSSHPHSTKYTPATPDLPKPFKLEHLCQLPTNLAKTELGVRPCVAFLRADNGPDSSPADIETALIPRLDAKEVAAVFSGPLHGFLRRKDEGQVPDGTEGEWYKGSWIDWHATQFRMHNFYVPIKDTVVTRPRKKKDKGAGVGSKPEQPAGNKPEEHTTSGTSEQGNKYLRASQTLPYRDHPPPYTAENPDPLDALSRFRVFGMTARILVDCARVAYGEEPDFEHNSHFGDEGIIRTLVEVGKMDSARKKDDEFVGDDLARALSGRGFGGLVAGGSKRDEKL